MFDGIASRVDPPSPFRVLFVGRIERDKGVYDLLEIARQLEREGRRDIEFDVCGTGSVLAPLEADVTHARLGERFRLHGHARGAALRERFARSHVVVVPTRSTFNEGFNAVVSEAVLSGRPVITSRVCPALGLVAEGAIEVEPDDVAGYRAAIERLCGDAALYAAKRDACGRLAAQFLDVRNSWGAGLSAILRTAAS
jgi:glycosyltransferase involved in cell wall biosynthesis